MSMNYTPVPDDWLEEMDVLSDDAYGRLIRWCQHYRITGETQELTGDERFFAKRVKMQIDRYVAHYNETLEKRRRSGQQGGVAKASKAKQSLANDGNAKQEQANDSKIGETKTNTKTKTKTNLPSEGTPITPLPDQSAVQWAENVTMTNDEHDKLLAAYGPADTARLIEILDNYKGSTGKRYKSDYRAILSWVVDRLEEDRRKAGKHGCQGASDSFSALVAEMEGV